MRKAGGEEQQQKKNASEKDGNKNVQQQIHIDNTA